MGLGTLQGEVSPLVITSNISSPSREHFRGTDI